jgi:two-component system OmpR family sensor kinase
VRLASAGPREPAAHQGFGRRAARAPQDGGPVTIRRGPARIGGLETGARRRTIWPRSLRWRLTLAVCALIILAFGGTLLAVYGQTDARLRGKIDGDLRKSVDAFAEAVAPAGTAPSRTSVARNAAHYVSTQPFQASSQLLYAVVGGRTVTNERDVFGLAPGDTDDTATRRAQEAALADALAHARPGLATRIAPDVGALRVLVRPITSLDGGTIARIAVGQPLSPVEDALDGILRGFAIGGAITLALALLLGFGLASWFAAPLRRMAQIAARVDAGDLSPRLEAHGPANETRILADAFDHMLDRLEEAFARQQAFASDASHELRTPLTAIRGQLEVLARNPHPDQPEVQRVQRLVSAEVDRMTRLTEDLLLLAHSEETRLVQREPIELEPLLADLIASAQPTADRRFSASLHAPGVLNADRDRVTQALRNLLRNATEHTQPGGRIELGARPAGAGRVQVWVDDDGPGIPAAERERVFDRFHRTDGARARRSGGTGLGLAIVQTIVGAHGGRAWAEESPLGGARVVIELPGYRPLSSIS